MIESLRTTVINEKVEAYIEDMVSWMTEKFDCDREGVVRMFEDDRESLEELFSPYPETIFHDDPAKWAEIYAIRWGWLQEQELEFM